MVFVVGTAGTAVDIVAVVGLVAQELVLVQGHSFGYEE